MACNIDHNHKAHKLTFGYIHEMEKIVRLGTFIICDDIIGLCLLYFFQCIDEFLKDKHGAAISLSMNQHNRLTKLDCSGQYSSAFGAFIIDFAELADCIIEWSIDITKTDLAVDTYGTSTEVSMGIMPIDPSTDHKNLWDNYPFTTRHSECYGLWIGYDSERIDLEVSGVCERFPFCDLNVSTKDLQNCSITMRIDINEKIIKYLLNGKDYGLIFKEIDSFSQYQLVVSVCAETSLEISNFEITYKSQ